MSEYLTQVDRQGKSLHFLLQSHEESVDELPTDPMGLGL